MTYDEIQRQHYVVLDDDGFVITDNIGQDRIFSTRSEADEAARKDAAENEESRFVAVIVARVDIQQSPTVVLKSFW